MRRESPYRSKYAILSVLVLVAMLATQCTAATPAVAPQPVVQTVVVQQTVMVAGTPQVKEVVKEVTKEVSKEVVVTATPPPAGAKVLRIANAEPTQGTSPLSGGTSASERVWELMHDPLWDRDANFQPVPWLAESWQANADSSVWTFKLRQGLTFSDGSPLTSADVQASFNYLKTSKLWTSPMEPIKSIDMPDPLTVVFNLTRPTPEFLYLPGSLVQFSIFSKKAIDAGADWTKPMQSAYSGPYILKEYVPKDHLTLVKNPHYWKQGYPKFDQIDWRFTEDPTAGVAAVESGTADVYSPFPAADWPRLTLMKTVAVYKTQEAAFVGFGFDRSKPPLDDVNVRKAIAVLLDPEQRNTVCWFATGDNLYGGMIYEWQKDYYDNLTPYKGLSRDDRIKQAGDLLDKAGWVLQGKQRVAKGVKGVTDGTVFSVDIPYEANWQQAECHTQLMQDWGKGAGLQFNPVRYDPGAYWTDAIAGKFQMWHAGIPSSPFAPGGLYQILSKAGTWNPYWFHGDVPELDTMLDKMNAEPDPAKKKVLLTDIDKYVSDNAFLVTDGSQNSLVLTSAKLTGFFPRSDDSNRALILADYAAK